MKANILLVEDNWIAAEVVRTVLESRGHAVMLATTGRQAMEWISYQSYDLILLDLMSERVNDFETVGERIY